MAWRKDEMKESRYLEDAEAMEEAVEMEQESDKMMKLEESEKEKLVDEALTLLGRIQASDMLGKLATVSGLMWLKQVKDSKAYRHPKMGGTWEKFCEKTGKSARMVNEQLNNLNSFGAEFLETVSSFGIGYREMKQLRQHTATGNIAVEGEIVQIGDEKISLSDKDELKEALETLLKDRDKKLEDAQAVIKSKDRILQEKEKVIVKQEKELASIEKQAKKEGLNIDDFKFRQEAKNFRESFNGYFIRLEQLESNVPDSAISRAELMSLLDYIKRAAEGTYNSAAEIYGGIEDEWEPPMMDEAE